MPADNRQNPRCMGPAGRAGDRHSQRVRDEGAAESDPESSARQRRRRRAPEETVDGIVHRTICECKDWRTNIPRGVVHGFRTVMEETGAHRGYIISRVGFQAGAIEAAKATNIDLVTFAEFQNIYFNKWISKRIWAIENEIGNFNTYYEPLGPPGYGQLKDDNERAAYDAVWDKYAFAGLMLQPFSPYMRMVSAYPFPPLPFDVSDLEKR